MVLCLRIRLRVGPFAFRMDDQHEGLDVSDGGDHGE